MSILKGWRQILGKEWELLVSQPVGFVESVPVEITRINNIKSRIWKLTTMLKIKLFLPRVLSSALAVAECLRSHGMQADLGCKICHAGSESIIHVLFEFIITKQVWSKAKLVFPQQGTSATIASYMEHILKLIEDVYVPVNFCLRFLGCFGGFGNRGM